MSDLFEFGFSIDPSGVVAGAERSAVAMGRMSEAGRTAEQALAKVSKAAVDYDRAMRTAVTEQDKYAAQLLKIQQLDAAGEAQKAVAALQAESRAYHDLATAAQHAAEAQQGANLIGGVAQPQLGMNMGPQVAAMAAQMAKGTIPGMDWVAAGMTGSAIAGPMRETAAAAEKVAEAGTGIETAMAGALSSVKNLLIGYLSLEGAIRITRSIVEATVEVEKANLRLEAVVRATGGVAGFTAGELRTYAEELAKSSLFDSEQIKAAEAELSIFRNVAGETFQHVIRLAMDLSALTGRDLLSSTKLLGTALNDPINGYTQLGRAIGRLSPDVQRAIKDAAEHGNQMRAQKLMIDELSKSLGGNVAGGMAGGMAGAVKNVGEAWRDFKAQLGQTPQIRDPIVNTLKTITAELRAMAEPLKTITPEFAKLLAMSQGRPTSAAVGAFLGGKTPTGPAALGALGITGAGVTIPPTPPEKWHLKEPWPGAYLGWPKPPSEEEIATGKRREDAIKAIIDSLRKEADTTGFTSSQIKLYELAQLGASAADQKRAETLAMLADIGDTRKDALRAAAGAGEFAVDIKPELRSQADIVRDNLRKHPEIAGLLGFNPLEKPDNMDVYMNKMGFLSAKQIQEEFDKYKRLKADAGPTLYEVAWKEAIRGIERSFANFYETIFTSTHSLQDLVLNMLRAINSALANLAASATIGWLGKVLKIPGMGGGGGIPPAPTEAIEFAMPLGHKGGIANLANDEFPAILQKGEIVLPKGARLGDSGGAGQPITLHVTNTFNVNSIDPRTTTQIILSQAPAIMSVVSRALQDVPSLRLAGAR